MVRAIRLSIEAVARRLEDAAASLGAGPAWVFLVITLPLALPSAIAGMILSFARTSPARPRPSPRRSIP